MKKVLLFPGAFNPPHLGHVAILEATLKKESFDEIWIIPSGNRDDKVISTTYEDRRNFGNLFVEFLRKKISTPIKLITDELDDAKGRPTQEILEEIKSQPDIQTVQLIGSDGMVSLQASSDKQLNMEDFIVAQRDSTDISSTQIRIMIQNGDWGYQNLVPQEIADYIDINGLYQTK
jgi:nicotinate-nucleotide adenylyltransferase